MQGSSRSRVAPGGSAPPGTRYGSASGTGADARQQGLSEEGGSEDPAPEEELETRMLPPPVEVDPNKTYVAKLRSGATTVLTGAEALRTFAGPQPAGTGQDGSSGETGASWSDLLRALGGAASTIIDDATSDMSDEEREALRRIAKRRQEQQARIEALKRQRRWILLSVMGAALAGAVWYLYA